MALASDPITAAAGANDAVTGIAGVVADQTAPGAGSAAPAADDSHKVFAGNLAFSTTEDDLKAIFSEIGKIEHIQIITRGTRSLGYCFITYSTEAEAQKAVSTLNKRVIAGREINVEAAKPQEELTATREAKAAARKEKLAAKKKASAEAKAAAAAAAPSGEAGAVEGAAGANGASESKKKAKSRKPRGRRARTDDGEEAENEDGTADDAADAEATGAGADGAKKRSSRKKGQATKAAIANGEVDLADGAAGAAKRAPKPRGPKGAPEGEPSKTLVFAANLSFDVDDDALKAAFEGLNVTSAHVVRRRFGARKSKGFGFVEFASEEEQKKALEQFNGKDYLGRPLTLKIAVQGSKEQAEAEAKTEAQAATA
ncbi:unnamed protein product [Parajaminaea phylloscopi]